MSLEKISPFDPHFLAHVFWHVLQEQREHPLVQLLDLETEARFSLLCDLSVIQDSFRFRALHRARRLSLMLIDEEGELKKEKLQEVLVFFEKEGFIFYPAGTNDSLITEHILHVLRLLNDEKIQKSIKRFQRPLVHKGAELLICETLQMPLFTSLSNSHIRSAVLCALLTPLRQSVGSCFATAPAILIQREQIPLFLDDLYQLLTTGKLKRTFGGVEYAVPLSLSTGVGDLKKNLISGDVKARAGFCPGLIASLEVAGLLDSRRPLEEKGAAIQSFIEELSRGKGVLTVEDLIRRTLLRKFSLSEEELRGAHSLEISHVKRSKTGFVASDPATMRKLDRVTAFKEKEKECRAVFKGVCDNALLKAWEFTLASFSEVKMEFSRWNLYFSLGLSPQENGGIGALIQNIIEEKVAAFNQRLQEYQTQYEIAFNEVKTTESLLRKASSETQARRLQAEYQSRAYHMRSCLEMRDETYAKGSKYTDLFALLYKHYEEKFPEYFQEVYDAQMQGLQGDVYDDSPAGFRLVYKHGRADPSLWTFIDGPESYVEALVDFFLMTQSDIAAACDWEGGDQEILEITSAIIAHVRSTLFLETALQRMAKAHAADHPHTPLAHLHTLEKKPWSYTSGGTMTTLLKTYFHQQNELTQEEKWVESESELLIFILDALKTLPAKTTDPYLKNPWKGMLMTSPTHAFVLFPGAEEFSKGWQEDLFTYTWVRDEIFLPGERFYSQMQLSLREQEYLLDQFCEQLPPLLGHSLGQLFSGQSQELCVKEWRAIVLEAIVEHSGLKNSPKNQALADGLDAFLYQHLPLVESTQCKESVRRLLSDRMDEKLEHVLDSILDSPSSLLTAQQCRDAAKGCFVLAEKSLCLPFDIHHFVAKHSRFIGLSQPSSLLFADTNWSGNYFGFVVNPGTARLELWRFDRTLSQGVPMSQWKQWLNGTERKTWSVFTRPSEYGLK